MTSTPSERTLATDAARQRRVGRAFAALSTLASFTALWVCALSFLGKFPQGEVVDHLYGRNPSGSAGAWPRLFDTLSYFTNWSTFMVGIASAVVAWFSLKGKQPSFLARVLLLDALVMITVTAIVYAVLLAPGDDPRGISVVTNPLQHIAIPALTVVLFLTLGPRGWLVGRPAVRGQTKRLFGAFWVIPAAWVAFAMVRGTVINAYPYGFVDAATHEYISVTIAVAMILMFGLGVAALFWWVDRLLTKRTIS